LFPGESGVDQLVEIIKVSFRNFSIFDIFSKDTLLIFLPLQFSWTFGASVNKRARLLLGTANCKKKEESMLTQYDRRQIIYVMLIPNVYMKNIQFS